MKFYHQMSKDSEDTCKSSLTIPNKIETKIKIMHTYNFVCRFVWV